MWRQFKTAGMTCCDKSFQARKGAPLVGGAVGWARSPDAKLAYVACSSGRGRRVAAQRIFEREANARHFGRIDLHFTGFGRAL